MCVLFERVECIGLIAGMGVDSDEANAAGATHMSSSVGVDARHASLSGLHAVRATLRTKKKR